MMSDPRELTALACRQCGTTTLYEQGRPIDGPRICPGCGAPSGAAFADRYGVRLVVLERD